MEVASLAFAQNSGQALHDYRLCASLLAGVAAEGERDPQECEQEYRYQRRSNGAKKLMDEVTQHWIHETPHC
jgi:hypothetical protein